eukprot:CAMPEP_0115513886 /NCGR_PEP_ID=MMETSP0271-20121206/75328_1 /TAXON_ID=71861 /ORGANISM="Scrippsiella trochoidea, Strain CCMP3099" /LENGTH=50 /DNA_ID=CAMNT_0002944233 /DNA_START=23 /DNA_END=175 /DNA_ORIENTATION=+
MSSTLSSTSTLQPLKSKTQVPLSETLSAPSSSCNLCDAASSIDPSPSTAT